MFSRLASSGTGAFRAHGRSLATLAPPRLFDYATITKNLKPNISMVNAIESAFGMLAKNLVDVPLPMHIGNEEQ
jgi:hypothetical protein